MRWHLDAGGQAILIVLGAAAVGFSIIAVTRRSFALKAETWPMVTARIENVFLDVSSRGPNRPDETHAVLAYSYSIQDAYCSGQIRLWAGEASLESLEKELVGQEVRVHCNPKQPEESIFLEDEVRGWDLVKDCRISVWSWF